MVLLTSGQIAAQVGENRDRVSYALRRANVEPVARLGIIRVFGPDAVDKVRQFLDAKKQSARRGVAQ